MRARILAIPTLLGVLLAGCGLQTSASPGTRAAATVNGQPISMAAYNTEVKLKRYTAEQTNQGVDICAQKNFQSLCRQLKRTALSDLIAAELERQYAARHHITVSPAELNAQWVTVMHDKFDNKPAVARAYAQSIHVTVNDLKQQVRQNLLEQRVMGRLTAHLSPYGPAIELSRITVPSGLPFTTLRRDLKSGMPFSRAVHIFSQNNSACQSSTACGDLGWFPIALLAPNDTAYRQARAGDLITNLGAQTSSITRVNARTNQYRLTPTQLVALREQYLTNWLKKQLRAAKVHKNVPV